MYRQKSSIFVKYSADFGPSSHFSSPCPVLLLGVKEAAFTVLAWVQQLQSGLGRHSGMCHADSNG